MRLIQPIILIPQGEGTEEQFNAANIVGWHIMQFWESRYRPDLMVYWLRPLRPPCPEDGEYFGLSTDLRSDDTVWSRTKQWIKDNGYADQVARSYGVPPEDIFFVVFLKDYSNPVDDNMEVASFWGWGSIGASNVPLRVAVIDMDLLDDLIGVTLEALDIKANKAVAIVQHEILHLMGFWHTPEPFPNLSWHWWLYPAVLIPPQSAT